MINRTWIALAAIVIGLIWSVVVWRRTPRRGPITLLAGSALSFAVLDWLRMALHL